ncbi:MAG: molybdenum cofactor guanylyltransferase [Candidatus Bathyarchaeia archaeon]
MDRSAIILAEDSQGKFSEDKAFLNLDNKRLLNHVVDSVKGFVGEVLVVTSSIEQSDLYAKLVSSAKVKFVVSDGEPQGDLAAALVGFEASLGDYSLLLPFDAPFVSREVGCLLFELAEGKSAVVPRWPDCKIEPLHSVYNNVQACEAAKKALAAGELTTDAIAGCMRGVRYVSTMVIEQLDPDFRTFFRICTVLDLKKAAVMLKPRRKQ